jgi:hypothetical protein
MAAHILRVFEYRLLRRIFGPKRGELKGYWRKLHTEELHNMYSSSIINRVIKSRRIRWAGHVVRMAEEKKNAYRILVGKPEGKRLLGRPTRRWVDNIKLDLREIGWYGLGRSGSGYGSMDSYCEHGNEISGSIKYWEVLE